MTYVFNPAKPVSLPVTGTDQRFPVRRIYCVGKNYAKHVIEMGGDIERSDPVFFTKAAQTIVESHSEIPYPPNTENLHYEVELVVAMGLDGIFGYAAGIDMTRRDLQADAKKKGGPWDRAKNFDHSAPCSAITPVANVELQGAKITLRKNGTVMQSSKLDKMIWSVGEIIERLAVDMDLQAGDLIFTGTPEGVGPAAAGDELIGEIDGLETIRVRYI
ncbi:MAG: fumarylacetoacetate hydrolase family protein [Hellea sp.]|nr:fumarylacetoacetate hydrolase family protein [Hellea sp.]